MSTFGSYGNTAPFLRLGEELVARGHDAHLWTNYPLERISRPQGLAMHSLGGSQDYKQFINDAGLLNRFESLPTVFRRHYLPAAELEFSGMEKQFQRGSTLVVSSDAPGIAARLMAEKYSTPLISVFSYPSQLHSASLIGALLAGPLRGEMTRLRTSVGLGEDFEGSSWWNQPHHYFALWPAWFGRNDIANVAKVSFPSFLFYDPEPEMPNDCEVFLGHSVQCVLVTGGSAGFSDETFLKAAVLAIRSAGLRAIVVSPIAIDEAYDIQQMDRVPSLSVIMRRVAAIIHHGGMGTIGQALQAGIPQLILADGGDRPENGEIVQHLGLGQLLRRADWQPSRLRGALLELLNSASIREATALRAQQLDASRGLDAAVSVLERMADRALLAESCVYTGSRTKTVPDRHAGHPRVSELLSGLSPERRYLLMQALRSRDS